MPEIGERIAHLRSRKLSANLNLYEAVRSDTAERHPSILRKQLNPPAAIVERLTYVAQTTFQPLREQIAYPIHVTSGWRSPRLNKLVGSNNYSQHLRGEALDLRLSATFLTDLATEPTRKAIANKVKNLTGRTLRKDVNANFYLFIAACTRLEELDIDQVIHEFGEWYGRPAWIHVAASTNKNRRQILSARTYATPKWLKQLSATEAARFGTSHHAPAFA